MSETKICKKCGVEKPIIDFAKSGRQLRSNGEWKRYYRTTCKQCSQTRKTPIKPDGSVITCKGGQRYIKENGKWVYMPYQKPYYLDDFERIQSDMELINSLYGDEFKPIVRWNKVISGYFISKYGKVISTRGKTPIEIKIVKNRPVGASNSKRKVLSTSFKVGLPPNFFDDYVYKSTDGKESSNSSVRIATHRAVMETWKPIDEYPPDQLKNDWDKAPESFKQWVRDTAFIDHIDDDPTNNCLDNLRWVTPLQNHYRRKKREFK
mgnify:FL=1